MAAALGRFGSRFFVRGLEQPGSKIVQSKTPGLPFVGQARCVAKDYVLNPRRFERIVEGLGAAMNAFVEADISRVQVEQVHSLVEIRRIGEDAAVGCLQIHTAPGTAEGPDGRE